MIPKECKRLAEVDFPIAVVSKHSAREKSIRHGHPSSLHLWWARRPLAACRAMLLGLLLPDPCDEHCPKEFKEQARTLLRKVPGKIGTSDKDLQLALLRFIGDFANWELSSDGTYLEVSRGLVKSAHPEEKPLVADPFAGGGSIPLEALRLGCDAFASDLNPVACLVEKALLEDIPRYGLKFVEDFRQIGMQVKVAAEKELMRFYPSDADGSRPIAYLWARAVRCEEPDCGAEIPLVRTIWLAKRFNKNNGNYTKLIALDIHGDKKTKTVTSNIVEYKVPTKKLPAVHAPSITGGKAICPCCNKILSDKRVRSQLAELHGCADVEINSKGDRQRGAILMAIILRKPGKQSGIVYRNPNKADLAAIANAKIELMHRTTLPDFPPLPSEPLSSIRPSPNARGVSGATRIGITDFGRVFTDRQKLALSVLSQVAVSLNAKTELKHILYLAITKLAERSSSFVTWINSTEAPRGTFARQALTIAWDFIELVPIADQEEFLELVDAMASVAEQITGARISAGQSQQASALASPLPDESVDTWFTDPPYYDSVPYADLSDFFYVWLKRMIPEASLNKFADKTSDGLTPKADECTWNQAHFVEGKAKTALYFENSVEKAFVEGKRVLRDAGIGCVVFAHKTTEGWEALLSGMIRAGWVIVASWPITTERGARLNAKDAAALSASIHLVCRPRINDVIGDWGEVLRELPKRVGDWIERLQAEHVRGADLVFACIGPALEIFSRYSRVETADGKEVPLAEYLAKVWEVVGRTALEHVLGTAEAKARNGMAGALEEDARLTALFLWTLQSTNIDESYEGESDEERADEDEDKNEAKGKKSGYNLIYDVARRFAQPLGIHLEKWEGRIIETTKGVVRLLPVHERAKQLFGEEGVQAVAEQMKHKRAESLQMTLFAHAELPSADEQVKPSGKKKTKIEISEDAAEARKIDATTLDRVHAAMLLQAGGQSNALRALLKAEQERGQDFLRLANALSALYPRESEEKRLLDAMLLAVPR